jgi:hypothetical protein
MTDLEQPNDGKKTRKKTTKQNLKEINYELFPGFLSLLKKSCSKS